VLNIPFLVFGGVTLLALAPGTAHGQVYSSYAFDKRYSVAITDAALEASPDWEENEEHPPLSARRAIVLATKLKDKLVKDSAAYKWKLQQASLRPAGDAKWFWFVHFHAQYQEGFSTGVPHHLRLAVLMDGTAIKPTVTDRRK
jgi:hypothetical protein